MAAAAVARLLRRSVPTGLGSTSMGLRSSDRLRLTTRPVGSTRPFSSKSPDPKKVQGVAEKLVNIMKEPVTEAIQSMAESLVNELKSLYPAAPESEVKVLVARLSQLEKAYETRFSRVELKIKYLSGFSLGMYFLFTASLVVVPAGFYYASQENKNLTEKVRTLTTKVDTLEGNKVPTKVELDVKFPQD